MANIQNKAAYVQDLKALLLLWHGLESKDKAIQQEYTALRNKITAVCQALDEIERAEVVR